VSSLRCFKTVTSITGAGWARDGIAGTEDHIIIGFGDLIGLPSKLTYNTVIAAYLNGVREGTAPVVTMSATVRSLNTVDLSSALNGTVVDIIYLA